MLKKSLVFLIIVSIVLSSAYLNIFSEEDKPSEWAKRDVQEAIELGIVPANIQSSYTNAMTREEFASLFVTTAFAYQKNFNTEKDGRAFGTHAITKAEFLANVKVTDYSFTDTTSEDVKIAYMMGLVNGTSKTTFSPNNKITRQEAAVMFVNYYQLQITNPDYKNNIKYISDINKTASWAKDSLIAAFSKRFILGTSGDMYTEPYKITMSPLGNFTREQAIIVALRMYKADTFITIKLRGTVDYIEHALKVDWEVSSNTVTAVRFKDGMRIDPSQDYYYYAWNTVTPSCKYPSATSEQRYAGGQSVYYIQYGIFSEEMIETAGKGENAVFDLGYAEYEMLGKNFIFQYRLKNNGVHNHVFYGGSKMIEITKKKLR